MSNVDRKSIVAREVMNNQAGFIVFALLVVLCAVLLFVGVFVSDSKKKAVETIDLYLARHPTLPGFDSAVIRRFQLCLRHRESDIQSCTADSIDTFHVKGEQATRKALAPILAAITSDANNGRP